MRPSWLLVLSLLAVAGPLRATDAPTTRELERINWMEFREWVPSRIQTVLLPLGTLEPHGVTANGADILINGHGGGQTALLTALAEEVGREEKVRLLVVNWWSYCADVTQDVFGQDGGHAGDNETALIQAIDPSLVHPERYSPELATAYPAPNTWSAYPFPSSVGLYKEGQGRPRFDAAKAKQYFQRVTEKVGLVVQATIRKWDLAGL